MEKSPYINVMFSLIFIQMKCEVASPQLPAKYPQSLLIGYSETLIRRLGT